MTTTHEHKSPPPLDAGQAARLLGAHISTVRRWADEGRLPHWRTPGGFRRFEVADLEAFKAQAVKA